MRLRPVPLVAAAAFACVLPATAQDIEGVIKMRSVSVSRDALSANDIDATEALFDVPIERILALRPRLEEDGDLTVSEVVTTIKGDLIRSDATGEDGVAWVIMDVKSGTIQVVQPEERMVMEMTAADMERMSAMAGAMGGGAAETPDVVETGLSREINGWSCLAYDVMTMDETTRVWVSNDDPRLAAAYKAFGEGMSKMGMGDDEVDAEFFVVQYGFPILTQRLGYDTYDVDEVLSFQRGGVSDDVFEVPEGYRKINMAQMMRGIGN